ncbi:hypothetical protein DFQ30_002953 [Apophysomyces sp. BC1015]|nr:hypothetical protein DFQ30_002953 [Apophysomyces sp. BC1015]
MAYAGSIALLTTVIILLSGYHDLISERLSYAAELAAWRILNLIIGIVIASLAAVFIFPLKASRTMRKNLAKALSETADMYERVVEIYLNVQDPSPTALNEMLTVAHRRVSVVPHFSFGEAIFSTVNPERPTGHRPTWSRDPISDLSNKALGVLTKLQTESTRVRNVANEAYLYAPFRIFHRDENRWQQHQSRAKRYSEAIEAMKRIVWPVVSYRLMLPLIRMASVLQAGDDDPSFSERITLTALTLESFKNSLRVMRQVADILRNDKRKLSEYPHEWAEIRRVVIAGKRQIQRELEQTIEVSVFSQADGLKLLSYYAFLVRCYFIWEELYTVVEKLSPPLDGQNTQPSEEYVLPQRGPQLPTE